ncbi:FxsC protein [Kitasatospora aburaviensis]
MRLARQLGFQATVHEFDGEAEEIIGGGEPTAPGLLLLDRWVLKDERWRELVRRFDRADCGWVSVLEPWNMDDPDCAEQHREMGDLSDQALRFTHRAARPSFLGATGGSQGWAAWRSSTTRCPGPR